MNGDILFLCHRIPFPPDRGDKIRSYHLLKALAEIAPVHVGCFADDDRDMGFASDMKAISASQCVLRRDRSKIVAGLTGLAKRQPLLVALFDHPALRQWVARTLAARPLAAVVAYSAQMAHFVPMLPPGVRFLMDFGDFDSAKYAAYGAQGSGPMAWINRREGRVLLDFERAVAARADLSTFVSEAEAALFRSASGLGPDKVRALDNGVALDFFDPAADFVAVDKGQGPLILFTGQMDYRPNVEAARSFARDTMPAIRAMHPQARFAIVGRNPDPAVVALNRLPGVMVTGAVPDTRGWLAAADVVVAPLRIARGVQNKVLEAMAMARPVVITRTGAVPSEIDVEKSGCGLFVPPNDPGALASALVSLADNPADAQAMGAAGRRLCESHYNIERFAADLHRFFETF